MYRSLDDVPSSNTILLAVTRLIHCLDVGLTNTLYALSFSMIRVGWRMYLIDSAIILLDFIWSCKSSSSCHETFFHSSYQVLLLSELNLFAYVLQTYIIEFMKKSTHIKIVSNFQRIKKVFYWYVKQKGTFRHFNRWMGMDLIINNDKMSNRSFWVMTETIYCKTGPKWAMIV